MLAIVDVLAGGDTDDIGDVGELVVGVAVGVSEPVELGLIVGFELLEQAVSARPTSSAAAMKV